MSDKIFRDPKLRFAYVATKVSVFCIAALATWPLSKIVGPKAWTGLGVFGAILAVMTVVVLFFGSAGSIRVAEANQPQDSDEKEDKPDPDAVVEIPIEDCLDLHSFPPHDVPDVVGSFLEAAVEKGLTEVRLIHGRGIGVQRERVQSLLARHPQVSGYHDAPPDRGGWGATIAYLRTE